VWKPKDPAESLVITWDFSTISGVTAVSAPVPAVSVLKGSDANPATMLSGSPSIQGAKVLQRIVGGISGCVYEMRCQADAQDGNRYVISEELPVQTF
jgi:hypothetical protein